MDVVYLCRPGDNEELRYSLRSLRNLPHNRVWIFGDAPNWVTNTTIIRTPPDGTKHRTTNTTMRAACTHPEVTNPFTYMNDDFYIMEHLTQAPTLNLGPIRDVANTHDNQGIQSDYVQGMHRTADILETMGYTNPLSFETHTPLIVYKQTMLQALSLGPYQRRSIYGALAGLTGMRINDVKLNRRTHIPPGPLLSTSDTTFQWAKHHLHQHFPDPSPYEK